MPDQITDPELEHAIAVAETSRAERVEYTDRDSGGPWRTTLVGADIRGRADNASWGAIAAGTVVALALMITFSLIAMALGFGIVDPTSNDPFAGVGLAVGLWSIVTLVVSLAAGAFVAGALAVRAGLLHGLAVWATSAIAATVAVVLAVGGLFGTAGAVVGTVATTAGRGVGTLADVAGDAAGAAADSVVEAFGDVDTAALGDDVEQVLIDTGVPELHPDYLRTQLDEARADALDAARQLVVDPGRYEQILDELATSLQERADAITEPVDTEAVATAVAANTDLTEAEAQAAVDNAVTAVENAADETSAAITRANEAVAEARVELDRFITDARETLDDASNAVSRASLWVFLGLIIGMVISAMGGLWGSRLVADHRESGYDEPGYGEPGYRRTTVARPISEP